MKSYSRRELYALGETLGNSATQKKLGGGRIYGGGGGDGGGQPSNNTTYTTNIPTYARPYVENMLGAAQEQMFISQDGQITGFRPYQPYSTDPTNYVAGPSGLQKQAYTTAQGMTTPGQFNTATGMAAMGGLGQLGTTGQAGMYGAQGAGLGLQAARAGQQYAQQATNPNAVAAYMSPYTQNVIDVQKAQAMRDYQKAMPELQAQAVRQGAFGGSRSAIQQAEAGRTLGSNLANIQAQGQQAAYDKALQNMQYGSTLGLQGLQAGMSGAGLGLQGVGAQQAGYAGAGQAASTLGQLGTAQQAADVQNINLQNQLGQQQQQYQQSIINQAIQDYATQQQYPMMQLSNMSSLLRGLPLQSTTTQSYQAQPSGVQQALGLGLGALGASKAFS